jgi:hypothetical protein
VAPAGELVAPLDAAMGPLVLLEWNASDPLGRAMLFDVYVDATDGDPLAGEPHVTNVTRTNLTVGPFDTGTRVAWAVEVRVETGGSALLGTARFNVTVPPGLERPVLEVDGAGSVRCFEAVTFHAYLPSLPEGGASIEMWFDFGDGNVSGWTSEGQVTHTYMEAGTYVAYVVVRDGEGRLSPRTIVLVVTTEGDKTSEDALPGPGALAAAAAVLGAAATSVALRRDRRRPLGRERGVG